MANIFISYRRDEDGAYTGRLYDRLSAHFGEDQVFMDVDAIKPGADFVRTINDEIAQCEILLVIIGDKWLTGTDADGRTRLKPGDYVRQELLAAIRNKKRVIPVLVGRNAKMPGRSDLPKSLQELSQRQAVVVSHTRFHADVDHLIQSLETSVRPRAAKPRALPTFVPFRIYKAHTGPVKCVAFSPHAGYIASGSANLHGGCDVRYWRVSSGEDLGREEYYRSPVNSLAFSPDGRTLAIGSGLIRYEGIERPSGLALWTLPDRGVRPARMSAKDPHGFESVAFSGDGRTLVAASGNYVTQWSVDSLTIQHRHGGSCVVHAVAFSNDGELLASGSYDRLVRIYRRDRVKSQFRMEGHADVVSSVCFAPDGTKLVSGSPDNTVRVWRVSDGVPLRLLDCASPVKSVAFSPDGLTLAAGSASGVHLWRVADYQLSGVREGHRLAVNQIAFSPDSKTLASASDDGTVQLWALD